MTQYNTDIHHAAAESIVNPGIIYVVNWYLSQSPMLKLKYLCKKKSLKVTVKFKMADVGYLGYNASIVSVTDHRTLNIGYLECHKTVCKFLHSKN